MNCARCKKKHRGISGLLPWKTGKKTVTYAGQGGLEDGPLKRIKYGVPEYRMLCGACMTEAKKYENSRKLANA